jgi:diguanylate cyclase (GGDEF)-like protein
LTENPGRRRIDPDKIRRIMVTAAVYLAAIGLALINLVQLIPGFEGLVNGPVFPYVHEPLELIAVIVALLAAHAINPKTGRLAILLFLFLSIPHTLLEPPTRLPELVRLLFTAGGGLFGVQLIASRKKMEARLSELVHSDPLTAVANSRHFHAELGRQLAEHRRYGTCGAVLFLDLDGFKAINDRFGHSIGDQILRGLAMRLQREIRDTDLVARMGGDEFAILLPHTDKEQARIVSERLSQTVASINPRLDDPSIRLSASFGVARYPENGVSVEELVSAADQAMYRAKQCGSGFVIVSDQQPTKEAMG